jgi:F1F0 ATPase subunit 2
MTPWLVGFVCGGVLGALHFGGLWLSLRRLPDLERPGLVLAGGYFLRLLGLSAGLFLTARWGGAPALIAALGGILLARQLLMRRFGPNRGGTP